MSRSNSTGRHDGITSFGAFAIVLAGLILALLAFYIMFSRRSWLRATAQLHAASISSVQSPSPESQQDVTTTDLETGISETLFFRTRKAFQHHSSRKSIRRKKLAEEAQRPAISTPIRMLPLDSPYIFVQSPLHPNSQVLAESRLPMEATLRPRRSRSLTLPESRLVLRGPTGILKNKSHAAITDAEAQRHAAAMSAHTSLARGLRRKRTIVWFDEPSDDDIDDLASVRTFRSNSLPSSTHSSWESTPGRSMIDEEPLSQRAQKISLGSVSQLWLVYQSETKGG